MRINLLEGISLLVLHVYDVGGSEFGIIEVISEVTWPQMLLGGNRIQVHNYCLLKGHACLLLLLSFAMSG